MPGCHKVTPYFLKFSFVDSLIYNLKSEFDYETFMCARLYVTTDIIF